MKKANTTLVPIAVLLISLNCWAKIESCSEYEKMMENFDSQKSEHFLKLVKNETDERKVELIQAQARLAGKISEKILHHNENTESLTEEQLDNLGEGIFFQKIVDKDQKNILESTLDLVGAIRFPF